MPAKGFAFVREAAAPMPLPSRATKPTVAVLAHHNLLIEPLVEHSALRESVGVHRLIREVGFLQPFTVAEVEALVRKADMLVVSPMRHSVLRSSPVYQTEAHAVKVAIERSLKIAVVIVERECAFPAYLKDAAAHVVAVAMFDDDTHWPKRHYASAQVCNIHEVPEAERDQHSIFLKESQRTHRPKNIRAFGRLLAEQC